jgi:glycosyltransferase involved in cell wall biosynthesis
MQNAVLHFHADALDTTRARLLGRHSAGESFLRGFLRHADVDQFHFWNAGGRQQGDLDALLRQIGQPTKPVRWLAAAARAAFSPPGVVNLASPQINREAWHRQTIGPSAYAVCGVTHTTASAIVMSTIADLLISPTQDFDALICTSHAVRASVETQLDGVRDYLAREYGPRRRAEPQRATIPLGVNSEDFAVTPDQRAAWRAKLDIPETAIVALYVGRFNVREKMNPALMALALEKAAVATGQPIYWVNSGWAESESEEEVYHRESRALCPSVTYIHVDGRQADVRFSIWSVADFFISFSDNIQETFGLTPIEAMAAGLPCVVTDWNGYKDTVRHGEDGFRVPTIAPAPGAGGDIAFWFSNDWMNYPNYVASAAQYTAIDYSEAVTAISALVLNPDLRRRLGEQARARAKAVFDWAAIIPQYQALWAEQEARRLAATPEVAVSDNPFRPDPFRLFGGYPTRNLALQDQLMPTPGLTWAQASARLATPLAAASGLNRPTLAEVEAIFGWLAANPAGRLVDLLTTFPADRRPFIRRGLLWLARYDVLGIRQPG